MRAVVLVDQLIRLAVVGVLARRVQLVLHLLVVLVLDVLVVEYVVVASSLDLLVEQTQSVLLQVVSTVSVPVAPSVRAAAGIPAPRRCLPSPANDCPDLRITQRCVSQDFNYALMQQSTPQRREVFRSFPE